MSRQQDGQQSKTYGERAAGAALAGVVSPPCLLHPYSCAPIPTGAWPQQGVPRGRSGGDSLGLWK